MTLISLQLTVFCSAFLETSMIFFEIAMLSLSSFLSQFWFGEFEEVPYFTIEKKLVRVSRLLRVANTSISFGRLYCYQSARNRRNLPEFYSVLWDYSKLLISLNKPLNQNMIFPQFCFVIWTSYDCIGNDFSLKTKDCYWFSSLVLEKSIFNSYIITCTQYNWKKHEHILCWPSKSANRIENNSVLICSSGTHIKLHFLFERIQSWIMTLLVRTIWTRVL